MGQRASPSEWTIRQGVVTRSTRASGLAAQRRSHCPYSRSPRYMRGKRSPMSEVPENEVYEYRPRSGTAERKRPSTVTMQAVM